MTIPSNIKKLKTQITVPQINIEERDHFVRRAFVRVKRKQRPQLIAARMKSFVTKLEGVLLLINITTIFAFTTTSPSVSKSSYQSTSSASLLYVSSSIGNSNNDNNDDDSSNTSRSRGMSTAIPFLQEPEVLSKVRTLPGNYGFDPLGFSKSIDDVYYYREAEIRHARLAMLAVVGWPLSEVWDRAIAEILGMPSLLDDNDRVPALFNGGLLDRVSPAFWGFCIGLTAAIEQVAISKSREGNDEYFPGNLGFDPLRLYPSTTEKQRNMQLAEIKHGRTAMIAITGFSVQEYVTHLSIVDETPFFFQPLSFV